MHIEMRIPNNIIRFKLFISDCLVFNFKIIIIYNIHST